MAAPLSYNMRDVARMIIDGGPASRPTIVALKGDSLSSEAANRNLNGVLEGWRVPWMSYWTGHNNDYSDPALFPGNAFRTYTPTRNGSWYGAGPDQTVSPQEGVQHWQWTGNEPDGGGIDRVTLNSLNARLPGGEWFKGVALKCDLIFFGTPDSVASIRIRGRDGGDVTYTNIASQSVVQDPAGYKVVTVDIGPTALYPGVDILNVNGYNENGKELIIIGYRFYRANTPGTGIMSFGVNGGRAEDHLDVTKCSDARYAQWYQACGSPNVIRLQIGQNLTAGEASDIPGLWASNVEAIIARDRRLLNSIGVTPRFWLSATPDTNKGEATHEAMALAMYNIARRNPDVGFTNLYRLAGGYTMLNTLMFSDSIHQSAAGARYFMGLEWGALAAAYSSPAADVVSTERAR